MELISNELDLVYKCCFKRRWRGTRARLQKFKARAEGVIENVFGERVLDRTRKIGHNQPLRVTEGLSRTKLPLTEVLT